MRAHTGKNMSSFSSVGLANKENKLQYSQYSSDCFIFYVYLVLDRACNFTLSLFTSDRRGRKRKAFSPIKWDEQQSASEGKI